MNYGIQIMKINIPLLIYNRGLKGETISTYGGQNRCAAYNSLLNGSK